MIEDVLKNDAYWKKLEEEAWERIKNRASMQQDAEKDWGGIEHLMD